MSHNRLIEQQPTRTLGDIMIKTIFIPALAGLAVLAAPTAVLANTAQDNVTVRVSTADLDLSSDAGAAELQKRIRAATFKACLYDAKGQVTPADVQFSCVRESAKESRPQVAQKIADARFGG